MQLHQLQRNPSNRKARRVGRGGKRGKTSGRGGKGQSARAGHKIRPAIRDVIKKLPKLRGYRFKAFRPKPLVVNVAALEKKYANGETVTPQTLVEKGVITAPSGRRVAVKLLGDGTLTKKLEIKDCLVSASAKEKILKAGGSVA